MGFEKILILKATEAWKALAATSSLVLRPHLSCLKQHWSVGGLLVYCILDYKLSHRSLYVIMWYFQNFDTNIFVLTPSDYLKNS